MLFIWYLWAVKYFWVPISLIVVKICAVLCPPVQDFILPCETLPRLVLYGCKFTLFLCCQILDLLVCFLAVILSEAWFRLLAMSLYPSLFCHLHVCPDLSFNLSIVFGSFWLASVFLQVSSLVTKIKDLGGNPGLSLPALIAKKFGCCVSYCLVEVGDHGVQISIFIYQRCKRCKTTPIVAWKALITVGSFRCQTWFLAGLVFLNS